MQGTHAVERDAVFLPNELLKTILLGFFVFLWLLFILELDFLCQSQQNKTSLPHISLLDTELKINCLPLVQGESYLILKNYVFFYFSSQQSSSLEMHLFSLYGAFIQFLLQMLRVIIKHYLKLCAEKLHKSRAGVQTGSATTESNLTPYLSDLSFKAAALPRDIVIVEKGKKD